MTVPVRKPRGRPFQSGKSRPAPSDLRTRSLRPSNSWQRGKPSSFSKRCGSWPRPATCLSADDAGPHLAAAESAAG